jgi:TonB family protein
VLLPSLPYRAGGGKGCPGCWTSFRGVREDVGWIFQNSGYARRGFDSPAEAHRRKLRFKLPRAGRHYCFPERMGIHALRTLSRASLSHAGLFRLASGHQECSTEYPALARQAQLQGTVILKLKILHDGKVLSAEPSTEDFLLNHYPVLQSAAAELVKKWTFGYFDCSENDTFEHVVRFVYKLEGPPKQFDDTSVIMELPNEVTVTASPPLCDHCPPPPKSKGTKAK